MALGREIVDFVRLHLLDDADEAARIRHVTVMQNEPAVFLVRVLVQMVDTVGIEQRGAPLDAVDFVTLVEQEFRQIGAILSGYARD